MTAAPGGAPGGRLRVIIVGGGIAGLAAAEALGRHREASWDVTLLESKRITGGRAGSFTDSASGETVDYCQHVALGCCTNLLALLERCGLADQFQRYSELQFLHPESGPSRFAASTRWPAPLHLAGALAALRHLDRRHKREIAAAMLKLMRTPSRALSAERAGDWLRAQGQSEAAIERFWNVILISALGEHTDTVSMAAARKVLIDGFAAARGASDLLVPRRPLSALFGTRLPAAVERLGVTVRTGRAVRQLNWNGRDGKGQHRVEVETAHGERLSADHVIAAVPWHALESLLGSAATRLGWSPSATFSASPITGLHLWLDRPITDRPHAVLVGTRAQWLFRRGGTSACSADELDDERPGADLQRSEQSPPGGHYYQVVISAAHSVRRGSQQQLVDAVLGELRSVFPAADGARVLHSRVVTDPQAVFSIRPESDAVRPPARTAFPGLHLAGDWIATGWPATMEGAVIGGRMAAASVAESEGYAPPPIDPGLPRGWLARWLIRP